MVAKNTNVYLSLQWDDPWYTTGGVKSDLDLILVNRATQEIFDENVNNLTEASYKGQSFPSEAPRSTHADGRRGV